MRSLQTIRSGFWRRRSYFEGKSFERESELRTLSKVVPRSRYSSLSDRPVISRNVEHQPGIGPWRRHPHRDARSGCHHEFGATRTRQNSGSNDASYHDELWSDLVLPRFHSSFKAIYFTTLLLCLHVFSTIMMLINNTFIIKSFNFWNDVYFIRASSSESDVTSHFNLINDRLNLVDEELDGLFFHVVDFRVNHVRICYMVVKSAVLMNSITPFMLQRPTRMMKTKMRCKIKLIACSSSHVHPSMRLWTW